MGLSSKLVTVQVLALFRFMLPTDFDDLTGCNVPLDERYGYDLVLSDGHAKAKVVLDPRLNHLVSSGLLTDLTVIKVRVRHHVSEIFRQEGGEAVSVFREMLRRGAPARDGGRGRTDTEPTARYRLSSSQLRS